MVQVEFVMACAEDPMPQVAAVARDALARLAAEANAAQPLLGVEAGEHCRLCCRSHCRVSCYRVALETTLYLCSTSQTHPSG